jgi:polyisoprenyl-teichoic acid--peptidoglycan teichoic acid transferase
MAPLHQRLGAQPPSRIRRPIPRRGWITLAAAAAILGTACSATLPAVVSDRLGLGASANGPLRGANTPTPFGPLEPSPVPEAYAAPQTATPVNPWGAFAGPVETSAIEIPPPMPAFALAPGTEVYAILGSDARPGESFGRNDTIMLAIVDPSTPKVTLLSIPRDLYVYVPGWRVDRVNTAEVRGGLTTLYDTLEYNFGLRPSHYVATDFTAFMQAVDLLGGLDVQVGGYLYDECGGYMHRYSPGSYHMDGFAAMCYVRVRKASSDFDRLRRQQEVMLAILQRVVSLDGLSRIPALFQQFSSLVKTDLGLADALRLVPVAQAVSEDSGRLQRLAIDTSMASGWRVPSSGASVLLPNRDAIQTMLATALAP